MVDNDPVEHIPQPLTEEQLAEQINRLNARRMENEIARQVTETNNRRPRGSARLAGFRATSPGPTLIRDPNEREPQPPDDGGKAVNPALNGAGALPFSINGKIKVAEKAADPSSLEWREVVKKIGMGFVANADKLGSPQARRRMRDEMLVSADIICKDLPEWLSLCKFALDIDQKIEQGPDSSNGKGVVTTDATTALRNWLTGKDKPEG